MNLKSSERLLELGMRAVSRRDWMQQLSENCPRLDWAPTARLHCGFHFYHFYNDVVERVRPADRPRTPGVPASRWKRSTKCEGTGFAPKNGRSFAFMAV